MNKKDIPFDRSRLIYFLESTTRSLAYKSTEHKYFSANKVINSILLNVPYRFDIWSRKLLLLTVALYRHWDEQVHATSNIVQTLVCSSTMLVLKYECELWEQNKIYCMKIHGSILHLVDIEIRTKLIYYTYNFSRTLGVYRINIKFVI